MTVPGGWELVLILLVILVLFGAKRLPDSARALGRSMRILKAETKGLRDDSDADLADGGTRRDTTVTAEPLPPASPGPSGPRPAHGSQQEGTAPGDADPRP